MFASFHNKSLFCVFSWIADNIGTHLKKSFAYDISLMSDKKEKVKTNQHERYLAHLALQTEGVSVIPISSFVFYLRTPSKYTPLNSISYHKHR